MSRTFHLERYEIDFLPAKSDSAESPTSPRGELRDKWEKNNSRKKRKEQQRQQREGQSQARGGKVAGGHPWFVLFKAS